MRRVRLFTWVVGALLLIVPAHSFSLPGLSDILIVEIQTGTTDSATEEFVELYNTSDQDIDISQYKLEYYSASSTFASPSRSIPLHGVFYAGKHYLVASTGYLSDKANDSFTGGFAQAGGHVQLISPDPVDNTKKVVHDLVGWGTALHPEGVAAPAPNADDSLQRKIDASGHFIDTDNNADDFAINTVPTPESDNTPPDTTNQTGVSATDPSTTPGQTDPVATNSQTTTDSTSTADSQATAAQTTTTDTNQTPTVEQPGVSLLPLQISELLPNPAPPASDSTDEYVELYNPNNEAIDLSGYKLQTGNAYSYSHTFSSGTLAAYAYQAFLVTETKTLLANSGGKARLIDPAGQIISETAAYEAAEDGQAWALIDGNWVWTTTPTPNEANILTAPLVKETTTSKTTTTATKSKTTTKKTTATVKAASTKKASSKKSTKSATAAGDSSASADPAVSVQPSSLHPGVLAGVSALAVGYAAYEYRHDLANRLYQFRRYRAARRTARQAAKGA